MNLLQKFFIDVFNESPFFANLRPDQRPTNFAKLSQDELAAHLGVAKYDDFQLTDAIRPSLDLKIKPQQGYRHDKYVDEETGAEIPVIMAAASSETLFQVFVTLMQRLGQVVDVVLETSHNLEANEHLDLYREHIDMPVLTSMLWEYEDLLLNDGCAGIAVLNPNVPQEIQFDEHKLLIIYGSPLEPFEYVLEQHGIFCNEDIKFITEAEHVHTSTEHYQREFEDLKTSVGNHRRF